MISARHLKAFVSFSFISSSFQMKVLSGTWIIITWVDWLNQVELPFFFIKLRSYRTFSSFRLYLPLLHAIVLYFCCCYCKPHISVVLGNCLHCIRQWEECFLLQLQFCWFVRRFGMFECLMELSWLTGCLNW